MILIKDLLCKLQSLNSDSTGDPPQPFSSVERSIIDDSTCRTFSPINLSINYPVATNAGLSICNGGLMITNKDVFENKLYQEIEK